MVPPASRRASRWSWLLHGGGSASSRPSLPWTRRVNEFVEGVAGPKGGRRSSADRERRPELYVGGRMGTAGQLECRPFARGSSSTRRDHHQPRNRVCGSVQSGCVRRSERAEKTRTRAVVCPVADEAPAAPPVGDVGGEHPGDGEGDAGCCRGGDRNSRRGPCHGRAACCVSR